jgi:hypothetical protein
MWNLTLPHWHMDRIKGGFPDNCERSAMAFAIRSYPEPVGEDPGRDERMIYILPMIFSRVILSNGTSASLSNQERCGISSRTGTIVIPVNDYH